MASGVASALRTMRVSAGISIRELERRTAINRGRLSMIERGIDPTPAELRAIFAALEQKPESAA